MLAEGLSIIAALCGTWLPRTGLHRMRPIGSALVQCRDGDCASRRRSPCASALAPRAQARVVDRVAIANRLRHPHELEGHGGAPVHAGVERLSLDARDARLVVGAHVDHVSSLGGAELRLLRDTFKKHPLTEPSAHRPSNITLTSPLPRSSTTVPLTVSRRVA